MPEVVKKILLIDDYKVSRDLLQGLLAERGLMVHSAKDGEDGLKLAFEDKYDLILIDLILPRLSTFSVVETMLKPPLALPVDRIAILYTVGSEEMLEPVRELGVRKFVLKSTVDQKKLIGEIISYL
ncbi:hypothetical protein A2634_02670 [Candidatus Amesbacteria bacterium RIFCSPHIGHO2_01_FULL_48_32]|uniref:Response regulatory domain-containing protein n=1 Tax=Candidatus Amesbacteria bacterium RIFCSPLOWO2_01_FULL_48_25 TaxID=1797259 RepID=A0A1F4ZDK1_9BACT|nr:MAG: hypothetical protein A2634_02670 [Candidatus Amesbacteria bacterium RIFCSPHIGHO2_01_FULL_48_32]OGD04215.1 MAG: hypothetical protein A2989_01925 [Candidatus Amesbacteria bacterium RIFCSPLOWO2_01_FULL_48_25]